MKVAVKFTKTSNGMIRTEIEIMNRGDYDTKNIFEEVNDTIGSEFVLNEKSVNHIIHFHDNKDEALAWSLNQIEELEKIIGDWRNVGLPKDYDYEF